MSSYQGGSVPRNGNWQNSAPPNLQRPQNLNPQNPQPRAPPTYQTPTHQQPQHWAPPTNHTNNGYMSPALLQQHAQQPQYISPAQLFHQSSPPARTAQYQRTPSLSRKPSSTSTKSSSNMAPFSTAQSDSETANLLISLAEEYFEAAHKFAPAVARSMTDTYVAAYQQLIATGLGCLDTALKRVKLLPRVEASVRLRYAGVLFEETENAMEAETALSQGIALCERNHYYDLKHAMQFLLAQFMAKKNLKAAMKSVDGHISEAELYHHFPWVYAFRFLRASFALASTASIDNKAAIQNLQAIAKLAEQQNDGPVHLIASLMEAMTHLKGSGPDVLEHAQRALAAAWAHQMDPDCKIPQLQALTHVIDVVCSIRQGNTALMKEKLKTMRNTFDEVRDTWNKTSDVIVIPIKRTAKSSHVVSWDTRMILGIGSHGGDDLMLSFLNGRDAVAISLVIGGFVIQQGANASEKAAALKYLKEGLLILDENNDLKTPSLLPVLKSRDLWRGQVLCYIRIYLAFYHAGFAQWGKLEQLLDELNRTAQKYEITSASFLGCCILYLTGIYHQGIGDLETALAIFKDQRFSLDSPRKINSYIEQLEHDIALLAALNSLWIRQHPQLRNISRNAETIEKLASFCEHHPSNDIRSVFSLFLATVKTQPVEQITQLKDGMNNALKHAQSTKNHQIMSIALSLMTSSFFGNVLGKQGESCAQAASIQSKYVGNPLWMSVSDGMLARHYELHGRTPEAQQTMALALSAAQRVMSDSSGPP